MLQTFARFILDKIVLDYNRLDSQSHTMEHVCSLLKNLLTQRLTLK